MERKLLYRWIAAGLIWLLLFAAAAASVRASAAARRAAAELIPRALTPDAEARLSAARELARAFAAEWASWSGDAGEYRERLSKFLKGADADPPKIRQEVLWAAALPGERAEGDLLLIPVALRVRRWIPQGEGKPPAAAERMLAVEVPVLAPRGGPPAAAGLPMLSPWPLGRGAPAGREAREPAPPRAASLLEQFLAAYYSGGDLANFLADGASVAPVGGWRLERLEEALVDDADAPSVARVRARVSDGEAAGVPQALEIELDREGDRLLVRAVRPAA